MFFEGAIIYISFFRKKIYGLKYFSTFKLKSFNVRATPRNIEKAYIPVSVGSSGVSCVVGHVFILGVGVKIGLFGRWPPLMRALVTVAIENAVIRVVAIRVKCRLGCR